MWTAACVHCRRLIDSPRRETPEYYIIYIIAYRYIVYIPPSRVWKKTKRNILYYKSSLNNTRRGLSEKWPSDFTAWQPSGVHKSTTRRVSRFARRSERGCCRIHLCAASTAVRCGSHARSHQSSTQNYPLAPAG